MFLKTVMKIILYIFFLKTKVYLGTEHVLNIFFYI